MSHAIREAGIGPAQDRAELLAPATAAALREIAPAPDQVLVAAIDPEFADSEAVRAQYEICSSVRRQLCDRRDPARGPHLVCRNPIGVPADCPVLVDEALAAGARLEIGSGLRGSKLLVTGRFLTALPHAAVLPIAKA